tara:strand:+ start:367 stop:705 length:339 start_codon:yes stop_codon:yes gene_type:complete
MINTDKYEGHTEGVWEEVHFNWKNRTSPNGANIHTNDYVVCIKNVADVVFVNDGGTTDANWNLIKDAPLLLAEVKKLREQLKEANDVIQYALEMSSDDDSTRVFEDYLEVIE